MEDLPPRHIGFPDEDTMSCQDGLYQNHHYRDLRGYDKSDFERIKEQEQVLLDYDGDPNDDDAFEDLEDNEVWMLGLDPGIATTVFALCAIGAVPFTSCSGGEGHYEQHPLVAFWANADQMVKVNAAAEKAGVEICGVGEPGVMVYTHLGVELMMAFANELMR